MVIANLTRNESLPVVSLPRKWLVAVAVFLALGSGAAASEASAKCLRANLRRPAQSRKLASAASQRLSLPQLASDYLSSLEPV